jgi:predicted dehydrogenase
MNDSPVSRRVVLASALAATQGRVLGANDRIRVAMIGVGNVGRRHFIHHLIPLQREKNTVEIVGFSDIYRHRNEQVRQLLGLEQKHVHHDYRDLLSRQDVDAVWICTPEHWHFTMAMDALAAGKDLYLEKPITITIDEAKQLAAAVRKYNRIVQVGSQHLSDERYHLMRDVVEKGWIGQVLWAQSSYSVNSIHGVWNYDIEPEATAEQIDWKRWLGTAPQRSFSAERYFRWRKYWDYSGGVGADFFYHRLSPLLWVMGPKFPQAVSGVGGIYLFRDREVPDTYSTAIEYDSYMINIAASMGAAAGEKGMAPTVYGHEGMVQVVEGGIVVTPEWQFAKKFEGVAGQKQLRLEAKTWKDLPMRRAHIENFLESVRTRKDPIYPIELGYQTMVAIKLGIDSYRNGKLMAFDPKTERVLPQAPKRRGYEGDGKNVQEPTRS